MKKTTSILIALGTILAVSVLTSAAHANSIAGVQIMAASGPLPWDGPLATVAGSVTGTTAKLLAAIAFAVCGIGLLFSEGGGVRKFLGLGLGLSIIVGAGNLVSMFFNSGSGLLV
jgi:type IV secretion system protein TrbC